MFTYHKCFLSTKPAIIESQIMKKLTFGHLVNDRNKLYCDAMFLP